MLREAARTGESVTSSLTHVTDAVAQIHPPDIAAVADVGSDPARAQAAVADLLDSLGVDLSSEEVRDTPRRVAAMYAELLTPEPFNLTTFANDARYDELVVVRAIPFVSLCAHHLLPFAGHAHVAYIPDERIVGLSKLARIVKHFARALQMQERLTKQVADVVQGELVPKGVGVVVEAQHQCMTIRGVHAAGTTTVTSAMYGLLRDNPATRSEFLSLVGVSGA